MRILHVITGLNVGGAETMLAKLIEHSPHAAANTVVLSLLPPGPLAERIRACGVRIETLELSRAMPSPRAVLRLVRLARAIRPDVVHGWMYHGILAATIAHAALGTGAGLIWNVRHSLADPKRESRSTRLLLRLSAALSRRPDAIVYNSHAALREHSAHGYCADRAEVLPNGFDLDRFRPDPAAREWLRALLGIDPRATVVGHVARYHPMKDQTMLVEAVGRARAQGADLHLVMIGAELDDPPAELRRAIDRHVPPSRVSLLGARSDIGALMPGFDLFALSSAWGEGFPNVLGEALACGVPAVATDVGDSVRVVGSDGIVVAPGEAGAFARALNQLAALPPAEREALGQRGAARIHELYAISRIAGLYEDLHRRIATSSTASTSLPN